MTNEELGIWIATLGAMILGESEPYDPRFFDFDLWPRDLWRELLSRGDEHYIRFVPDIVGGCEGRVVLAERRFSCGSR